MIAKETDNYAVVIIVETPDGIPLVCDPKKPAPQYWKFPGGRSEPNETPKVTAARELREETGINIEPEELSLLHQETRGDSVREHLLFLFKAKIEKPVLLLERGADGEKVRFFSPEKIKTLEGFFPNHRTLAEKFYFLPPLPL